MKQVLAELGAQRKSATKLVLDARTEALAAGKTLADTIMSVAYKNAGVDFAFNAYDVVRAATKTGILGAASETLKKAGEKIVEYVADNDKTGSKELNDRYNFHLKEAFDSGTVLKTAEQRLAKDTISKPLKDKLNQSLVSKLFMKLYPDVRLPAGGLPAPQAPTNVAERFRAFIKSFSDRRRHLENLQKGIAKPWSSLKNAKSFGRDLVSGFLKDASKNVAKAYFSAQEEEAWAVYFEKQIAAAMYYPLWQAASSEYWDALDSYNGLLDRKAELLEGYSEKMKTRTTLDEKFPKSARLRITLKVERPAGTAGLVDVAVLVGGKHAAHTGGYTYELAAAGLKEGPSGLGLAIEAR